MAWTEFIEEGLAVIVTVGSAALELMGMIVLLVTAGRSFGRWIKKEPHVGLGLARGMALALQFKMGGEILRTVVAHEWQELAVLGAIIVLRTALALVIHWEMKHEKEEIAEENEE